MFLCFSLLFSRFLSHLHCYNNTAEGLGDSQMNIHGDFLQRIQCIIFKEISLNIHRHLDLCNIELISSCSFVLFLSLFPHIWITGSLDHWINPSTKWQNLKMWRLIIHMVYQTSARAEVPGSNPASPTMILRRARSLCNTVKSQEWGKNM